MAINQDITEEEVKAEQDNIQLKLFGGVVENVYADEVENNELYDIQNVPEPKTTKELDTVIEKVSEEQPEQEKTAWQKFNDFAEKVYTELYDRFAPIQNAVKKANKQGADLGIDITDNNWTENPYNLARMYSGLGNRIIQHFETNTTAKDENGNTKVTGEGFVKIVNDFYNKTSDVESDKETQLQDLSDYLVARRYLLD